jgi:putative aldouronate transport system permease protein
MSIPGLRKKSDLIFDTINISSCIIILAIVLYPLIYVISASLSDPILVLQGKLRFLPVGLNLDSYKSVFRNEMILTGYKNTVMYAVVGTIVNVVMTTAGAYPLSRKDFAGRNIIMMMFTFTMFFTGGLIPTYIVIKNLGLYDRFWVMILPTAVGMWNLIIMRTYFQNSIPVELQEAAFMDGCSNIGILIRIILPLSMPIIAVMVIFYGVGHWNAFFSALVYLRSKNKFPLQLVIREILVREDFHDMIEDEGVLMQLVLKETVKFAVIIVSSLPVLLLYPFLQKYFMKGVMIGAIKG